MLITASRSNNESTIPEVRGCRPCIHCSINQIMQMRDDFIENLKENSLILVKSHIQL